jgi:triacylglycerol lipase
MYIDSHGRVRDVEGWRRVLDRLRGFARSLRRFKVDHFSDHSMEDYIAHIHAAVQKQQQAMTQSRPSRQHGRTTAT